VSGTNNSTRADYNDGPWLLRTGQGD